MALRTLYLPWLASTSPPPTSPHLTSSPAQSTFLITCQSLRSGSWGWLHPHPSAKPPLHHRPCPSYSQPLRLTITFIPPSSSRPHPSLYRPTAPRHLRPHTNDSMRRRVAAECGNQVSSGPGSNTQVMVRCKSHSFTRRTEKKINSDREIQR